MFKKLFIPALLLSLCCNSCKDNEESEDTTTPTPTYTLTPADFSADSAYAFVKAQVDLGPRVPGTPIQQKCVQYLSSVLNAYCDTVFIQSTAVKLGNGQSVPCFNLIGSTNLTAAKRILLLAHWDTRPWADMDEQNKNVPIDGADDGASGVGVLLEMARQLKQHPLPADYGIDILLVDVEDYGKTEWGEDSYCLGTQYWAKHPHVPNYKAEFGILLDMVGAQNARFPMEAGSSRYAYDVQRRVYDAANRAGYSSYFPFGATQMSVTDDHVYVNEMAKIPTIDIIHLDAHSGNTFPAHWHTLNDNMSIIDKQTLKAVGQSVLQSLYDYVTEQQAI